MANDGTGTKIGNYILLAGLGAGGIAALYYVMTNFLVSPLNTYKDLAETQIIEIITKMDKFAKTNPSGFTSAQQESIDLETKILSQTTEGLANATDGIFDFAEELALIMGGLAALGITVKYLPGAISKYKAENAKSKVQTSQGVKAVWQWNWTTKLMADGLPNQAASFSRTCQDYFQAYDLPYMLQFASNIELALPTLTGIQAIVATQMMESLRVEAALIPRYLSIPLLPI